MQRLPLGPAESIGITIQDTGWYSLTCLWSDYHRAQCSPDQPSVRFERVRSFDERSAASCVGADLLYDLERFSAEITGAADCICIRKARQRMARCPEPAHSSANASGRRRRRIRDPDRRKIQTTIARICEGYRSDEATSAPLG